MKFLKHQVSQKLYHIPSEFTVIFKPGLDIFPKFKKYFSRKKRILDRFRCLLIEISRGCIWGNSYAETIKLLTSKNNAIQNFESEFPTNISGKLRFIVLVLNDLRNQNRQEDFVLLCKIAL